MRRVVVAAGLGVGLIVLAGAGWAAGRPRAAQATTLSLLGDGVDRPATLNIERPAAPASGITHTVYPVAQTAKSANRERYLPAETVVRAQPLPLR